MAFEAVGKNVKNISVNRVVYGDIAFGAYATARLLPADRLEPISGRCLRRPGS